MKIKVTGKSVTGKGRDHFYLIDLNIGLFIVCDGVGGRDAGEVASHLTVEGIQDFLNKEKINPKFLKEAIITVNRTVYQKSKESHSGMASTLVMLKHYSGNNFLYAHAGDSRLYRLRGENIQQLTVDHSWVNEQIKAGNLTVEEGKSHPKKNIILRAMGAEETIESDISKIKVRNGDCFLLCSDGLSDVLWEAEILDIFERHSRQEDILNNLIDLAVKKGSRDDVTAIILRIEK